MVLINNCFISADFYIKEIYFSFWTVLTVNLTVLLKADLSKTVFVLNQSPFP